MNDPTHQLVRTEDGSAVDSVVIDGHMVLSHGQFQSGIDLASPRSRLATAPRVDLARQSYLVQAAPDQG